MYVHLSRIFCLRKLLICHWQVSSHEKTPIGVQVMYLNEVKNMRLEVEVTILRQQVSLYLWQIRVKRGSGRVGA